MSSDAYHAGLDDAGDATGQHSRQESLRQQPRTRIVAGCMTGTSIDGIDVAVMRITGTGLAMRAQLMASASMELDGPFGQLVIPLRDFAEQRPVIAGHIADVSRRFSLLHAAAVRAASRKAGVPINLVVLHGQTVWHRPPVSWQLCSPAVVAHELGVPVISDLRAADLAAGGQGAPITPLADWVLFGQDAASADQPDDCTAIVNLGGFVNYTILRSGRGPEHITAGDVCVCNHVLDKIARLTLGEPFDRGGAAALRGKPNSQAQEELAALCNAQASDGRSLGTGDEMERWLGNWKNPLTGPDLCATACAAIGGTIGRTLVHATGRNNLARILVFGGGANNQGMLSEITRAIKAGPGTTVQSGDSVGIGLHEREAACMAVLGALSQDGVPITLPQVTKLPPGITAPVAGSWCGINSRP